MRILAFSAAIFVAVFSRVNAQGENTVFVVPAKHEGPYGEDYTYTCKLDLSSGSPPELAWEKDSTVIEPTSNKYKVIATQNLANSSTTSILEILNATAEDSGVYYCRHKDGNLGTFEFFLEVYQDYVIDIKGETILEEGADLAFTCTVDGSSTREITWKKDNGPLPENDRFEENAKNNTLVIRDAEKADAGMYSCIYEDAGREFVKNITVGDALDLTGPKSVKYTEGERARITCESLTKPEPTITWAKKNGTIEGDDRFDVLTDTKGQTFISTLLLVGVKMDDRGTYVCTASDDNGNVEQHEVLLRVRDRLAALWPFIGIMCEVIILIAIIFIHEKCTQGGDVGDDDDDDEAMEPIKGGTGDEKPNSDGEGDVRMRASKE